MSTAPSTFPSSSNVMIDIGADRLIDVKCGEISSVQGKSDFSLPGEVEPKEQPQDPPSSTKPAQPLDRRDEFQVHLTAALDVLSPAEQHRLMTALCQPSTSACVDALWAICTCSAVDDDQLDAAVLHSPGQQSHGEDCGGSSQCRHTNAPAGSLRREAVDTTTEAHFRVEAKSMASWAQAGFRVQPQHGSLQYTSYDQLPGAENVPDASQKRSRVPTKRLLGSGLGCDFDSSESEDTVAKHRKKPTKTTPKLSSTPNTTHPDASAHTDCAAVASKPAKLVREARSRSSVRDRIWDLLTDVEKGLLVREQMSAAEGAKLLLSRRAAAIGCQVSEIEDSDTWGISIQLTECRAQSEPPKDPRKCCLCLREGSVTTKHNYYCRRCQLIYRAIHRKKQQPALLEAYGRPCAPLLPAEANVKPDILDALPEMTTHCE